MADHDRRGYCPNCGRLVQPEDKYCGTCGAMVLPPAPQATQVIPEPFSSPQAAPSQSRSRKSFWFVPIGVAALGVLIILGSFAFVSRTENLEPLPGVHTEIPRGWELISEETESGSINSDNPFVEVAPEGDTGSRGDRTEAARGSAVISVGHYVEGECESEASVDRTSLSDMVPYGYSDQIVSSNSIDRGEGSLAGHEARWELSQSASALPYTAVNASSFSDYPEYAGEALLSVCVEDLDLSVAYGVDYSLSDASSPEDPGDPPTEDRNAFVPKVRQELHEEANERYEEYFGAFLAFLDGIEADQGNGPTEFENLPSSLEPHYEGLIDPFGEEATSPEQGIEDTDNTSDMQQPTEPFSDQPEDSEEIEQFVSEYHEAVENEDYEATYYMIHPTSRQKFTEEEWIESQRAREASLGTHPSVESVEVDVDQQSVDPPAIVTVNHDDGTEEILTVVYDHESDSPKRFVSEEETSYLRSFLGDWAEDLEAEAEKTAGDYYRAAGVEDWDFTYDNLDSETQSGFTREEWAKKNQWFADNGTTTYNIDSVELDETSQEPLAEVSVRLTSEDGSSSTRETYWVLEDGEWKHRFGQEEKHLFGPEVPLEDWIEAQGLAPPNGAEQYQDWLSPDELSPKDNGD